MSFDAMTASPAPGPRLAARMRAAAETAASLVALLACACRSTVPLLPPGWAMGDAARSQHDGPLVASGEVGPARFVTALLDGFDPERAFEMVRFADAHYREPANPGYDAVIWLGLITPKSTPPEIVTRLNAEITKIVSRPDVQADWAKQGAVAMSMTPAAFERYLADDIVKWERIVKLSGARPDR